MLKRKKIRVYGKQCSNSVTFSNWFDLSVQIRLVCWGENFRDCEIWLSLLLLLLMLMIMIMIPEVEDSGQQTKDSGFFTF